MLSVDQALKAILNGAHPLGREDVALDQLAGRIAACDHVAQISQPPFAASAMDGYAVRFEDIKLGGELHVIGESKAGTPASVSIQPNTAIRIFTGAKIPEGADHVIIQENVSRAGDRITVTKTQTQPRHIRPAGIDFTAGAILAGAGERLNEIHGSIFAAGNLAHGACVKKPSVAFFSNGDELKEPGSVLASGEVVNSNRYALSALIRTWGGTPIYLGCARDNSAEIETMFNRGKSADLIISIGGASVGDYDYVRSAFEKIGGQRIFEKVAVRPGKPTWCGKLESSRIIGLPGNPASAIVTAALFAKPLIRRVAGHGSNHWTVQTALTTEPLEENGPRETYLRAKRILLDDGSLVVTPYPNQDSSLLRSFANCDVLIKRRPLAPDVDAGATVEFVTLFDVTR